MNRRLLPVPVFVVAAMLSGPSAADRPLQTEVADAKARGDCEAEAQAARARTRGEPTLRAFSLAASCGIGAASELGLGVDEARGGGARVRGLQLGGKSLLRDGGDRAPSFGLAYAVAAVDDGAGWQRDALTLTALMSLPLPGDLRGHANLGVQRARGTPRHTTVWSLGIETAGPLVWAADVLGNDRGRPALSVGVGYASGASTLWSLTVERGSERPRPVTWTFGLKQGF